MLTRFIFYVLAAILVFAGARVITARNPVHAALFLVLAFFSRAKVLSGEIHAALELAACDLDASDTSSAEKRITALRSRFTCGRGVLKNPMLSARFLAYQTRLLLDQDRQSEWPSIAPYLVGLELVEL